MIDYIKKHESYVQEILANKPDQDKLKDLLVYHDQQIQWMQHERLIHLIVTLSVCLFTLIVFCFAVLQTSVPAIILFILLLTLSGAYLIHYYRLENSVQNWYSVASQIRKSLSSTRL